MPLRYTEEAGKVKSTVTMVARYERKLWMRALVKGVAYPPVDH